VESFDQLSFISFTS